MKIFLDTEFNGFGGDLISIGMVAEDGNMFYAVRNDICNMALDEWVLINVVPFLSNHPMLPEDDSIEWENDYIIKARLQDYLNTYDDIEIIVDWPEDVQHLCKFMITGPGYMITTPKSMQFTIDRSIESVSEVPHNALYDAIANLKHYISMDE